jgi:hypothetical protein
VRALAAERQGESICSFVRAFARGDRDPHVLRAVYEELAPYLAVSDTVAPLRASDSLDDDLQLDAEELEFVARSIAERTGRTISNSETNPHFGKVKTVRDLVAFLRAQPRVAA